MPVTDDGELDLTTLDRLLTSEVKVFAFVHVSNSLGTINPAAELCRRARAFGVTTLVDGAQSAGHMPVDVRALGCDFFALSGHKMGAPTGIGALYGRQEVLESMPPWQGGGEMINRVTLEQSTFKPPPARFEAGTPHIAGAVGLAAAIDYLSAIGLPAIAAHDAELTRHALDRLGEVPGLRSARAGSAARRTCGVHARRGAPARPRHIRELTRPGSARRSPLHPTAHAPIRRARPPPAPAFTFTTRGARSIG